MLPQTGELLILHDLREPYKAASSRWPMSQHSRVMSQECPLPPCQALHNVVPMPSTPRMSGSRRLLPPTRWPLGRTMALIFCSLLLIVVAGYSWAAYVVLRGSAVATAERRLSTVVDQFVTNMQTSGRRTDSTMRVATDNAVIRSYLKDRRPSREVALATELRKAIARTDTTVTEIVLLDATRQRAFT